MATINTVATNGASTHAHGATQRKNFEKLQLENIENHNLYSFCKCQGDFQH